MCTKEREKPVQRRLCTNKGIISSYFLGIMLFVTGFVTASAFTQKKQFEAIIHLRKAEKYQEAESIVISELKCGLLNENLKDGSYTVQGVYYQLSVYDASLYVIIMDPVQETMDISFNPDTKHITAFSADR